MEGRRGRDACLWEEKDSKTKHKFLHVRWNYNLLKAIKYITKT